MDFKDKIEQALISNRIFKTKHKELDLCVYCYTRGTQYDRDWDDITSICRGLILDSNYNIVGRGFNKFWNLLEPPTPPLSELEGLKFIGTEKIDGSLIIVFFYAGEWRVATKGSFYSPQADWANDWISRNVRSKFNQYLDHDYSYLFEAIYPGNQIVVKYGDREELVLLGAVRNADGKELSYSDLSSVAKDVNVTLVPYVEASSLKELQDVAKSLGANKEGFVATFENGMRVKIKSDEYCRVHKLISYMTPLAFWEMWDYTTDPKNPGIPKSYLSQLPEEFREECDVIKAAIDKLHFDIWYTAKANYEEACKAVDVEDRKAFALHAFNTLSKRKANYVLMYGKCMRTGSEGAYKGFWFAAHLEVRPTKNILPDNEKLERLKRISLEG